jgi:hypothetical protein
MSVTHRPIPICPPVRGHDPSPMIFIARTPTGKQEFSRAFSGRPLELFITTGGQFPPNARAILVTTMNAKHERELIEIPFVLRDAKTFTCRSEPERRGSIRSGRFFHWTAVSPGCTTRCRMRG